MKATDNKEKKEKRGLYFALAVCLVAIGIAAWGTYNSVSGYLNTKVEPDSALGIERKNEDPEARKNNAVDNPSMAESTKTPEPTVAPTTEPESVVEEAPVEDEVEDEAEIEDVDAPVYSLREKFINPVADTKITAIFSGDKLIYNETMKDHRLHQGQDLAAEKGQTVFAANNGVVKKTFNDLLLGNVIVIEHGDYNFWYCGLGDTFLVKEGDIVTNAKPIGSVTTVPSENSSIHLHLQIEKDGVFVDPSSVVFE